ncbi:MAG: GNAT family N-acetyltransferase [Candidatus Binatia bacterium]
MARSVAEIEAMRPQWQHLPSGPNGDIDYYLAVLEAGGEALRPHAVLVSRGGQPVTFAAATVERLRLDWRIGYTTVLRPTVRCLTVPHGAIGGEPSEEDCRRLARTFQAALAKGEADLLAVHELTADSPMVRALGTIPPVLCRDAFPQKGLRWTMSLPDSREAFRRAQSKHARTHMRYSWKRLQRREGRASIRAFTDESDLDTVASDIEAVALRTYQRRIGAGFVDGEATRRLMAFEMRRGWFRACVLYIDGGPCAYRMGRRYGDTYYARQTGYDPAFRKYGVGALLLDYDVERLCEEAGLRTIDFGFGDGEYKRRYGTAHRKESSIVVFAPTARGVLRNAARSAVVGANVTLKLAAKRLALFETLRRLARRRRLASVEES